VACRGELAATLRSALADLFDQEFSYSAGHVATISTSQKFGTDTAPQPQMNATAGVFER
jgi:hypothetical protein